MAVQKKKKEKRQRGRIDDWLHEVIDPETGAKSYELYEDRYDVIAQWARNGLTKTEIAENMRISPKTLNVWEKKCPQITEALKNARTYAHARVENALFKKAIGFTITKQQPVKKKIQQYDGAGKKIGEIEEIEVVEVTEEVPPDMGAIAFYLKNNLPQKYKDKWPEQTKDDDEDDERENMCLKQFTTAVAKAVIKEKEGKNAGS